MAVLNQVVTDVDRHGDDWWLRELLAALAEHQAGRRLDRVPG
ncbi:hypothetical protein [Pseudofrankia asymbiotica]|nr:hypothetical protein [Pseudofrankia asymbiotica]